MQQQPKLIAIVGGSGAGKTWLAHGLRQKLSPPPSCLSLDDFYRDRARLSQRRREEVNYDHPRAIDWPQLKLALLQLRDGKSIHVPRYSFATHTRLPQNGSFVPGPLVLVEGLWLLMAPKIKALFDLSVYVDCPVLTRLERRLERDVSERGREDKAVRQQFWKTVVPMHDRFVAPQACLADIVLKQPVDADQVEDLAETIRALLTEDEPSVVEDQAPLEWPTVTRPHALKERFHSPFLSNRANAVLNYGV